MEIAQTHGWSPSRRIRRNRSAAARPRNASIRIVESSRIRDTLTNPPGIPGALLPDPLRRVIVPFVAGVFDSPEARFDVIPPLFVLQAAPDKRGNKRAAATLPSPSVQFLSQPGRMVEDAIANHPTRLLRQRVDLNQQAQDVSFRDTRRSAPPPGVISESSSVGVRNRSSSSGCTGRGCDTPRHWRSCTKTSIWRPVLEHHADVVSLGRERSVRGRSGRPAARRTDTERGTRDASRRRSCPLARRTRLLLKGDCPVPERIVPIKLVVPFDPGTAATWAFQSPPESDNLIP